MPGTIYSPCIWLFILCVINCHSISPTLIYVYLSPFPPLPLPLDALVRAREAVNVRVNTPPRPRPAVWPISPCTRRATPRRSHWWINSSALRPFVEHGECLPPAPTAYYCALVLDDVTASCLASNSWDPEKPSHLPAAILTYFIS